LSAVALFWCTATATAAPPLATDALPGVYRTGFAIPLSPTIVAGGLTLGYGYTESQGVNDSAHHRQLARAALSGAPLPWLAIGARFDERYDRHPNDGTGKNAGWILGPSFSFRGTFQLSDAFFLGPDVAVILPGSESVSTSLSGTTVEGRLLASLTRGKAFAGLSAGFRLDRTGQTGKDAALMRPGSRLALGVSDYNAVLAAIGTAYALGTTTLKGELDGDLLVGKGAPSLSKSPLRVAAGLDQALGKALTLEAMVEACLSGRPDEAPNAPLVPVEPRVTGMLGLRFHIDKPAPPPVEPAPKPAPVAAALPPPPKPVSLDVRLSDSDGQPVKDARMTLEMDGTTVKPSADGKGGYHLDSVPSGKGKLHAEADGIKPVDREIVIGEKPVALELKAEIALPSAQVRGLVRSYQGKPLAAKITVDPGGTEAQTDAQGFFQLDVQPGEYDVQIEAPGFAPQKRHVKVDKQGVVVINADLVKGKP
jgi:hypothetical protein